MELKGKSLGVNSLSGGGWIFSMLMLDYWGLVPERDKIQFRTLGEQAVMAQGVLNGTVDASFLGYTFGKMLEGKGLRRPGRQREAADSLSGLRLDGAARASSRRLRPPWTACSEACWIASRSSAILITRAR